MRIARYLAGESVTYGVVTGDGDGALVTAIAGHPFAQPALTEDRRALADVRLLAPILPSKVVAIGKNYADHVAEMGGPSTEAGSAPPAPVVFLKPSTSVVGPRSAIVLPADSDRVDHEGELAVVFGRLCKDVPVERAFDVVLGYTVANDVTARDQQQADGQWARAKGHDTFCPLGPWVETELDPSDLRLRTTVDGTVRQDSRTGLLLHGVAALVAYVTRAMTMLPGDVLLTGTPAGVGPLAPGETVSVEIEGIGTLTNPVTAR